jgi:hypothetical protein
MLISHDSFFNLFNLNLGCAPLSLLLAKMRKIANFQGNKRRQYWSIGKFIDAENQDLGIFDTKTNQHRKFIKF